MPSKLIINPQWLDIEFFFSEERLYCKDIDNLITPVLEACRDAGWLEKGFNKIGSITARKRIGNSLADIGIRINASPEPPSIKDLSESLTISASPNSLSEENVKASVYDQAYQSYLEKPELQIPPGTPLKIQICVDVDNLARRKSIFALMKPCIDGLEPIIGTPDGVVPTPRVDLDRRLRPQDEMITEFEIHVRGGLSNRITASIKTND